VSSIRPTLECGELAPAFRADKSGGKPAHSKERMAGRQLSALGDGLSARRASPDPDAEPDRQVSCRRLGPRPEVISDFLTRSE
jgi:hypothetical protein